MRITPRMAQYALDLVKSKDTRKLFYRTDAWRALRRLVLRKYGRRCMRCKRDTKRPFTHIDHIKPLSKFPHLALEFSNLQVLCKSCNQSKSNKHFTDYRRK